MPSTASVLSAYTTFTATTMLARTVLTEVQTMIGQLIPQRLQEKVLSKLGVIFGKFSDQLTIFIDEYNGVAINEIYQSSEIYLSTRITPSVEQLKVSQSAEEKSLSHPMAGITFQKHVNENQFSSVFTRDTRRMC
ncbi:hypothetical protein Pint_23685 [Pistacia integerrima]|uniref:Uncharacterized protein n=1 Tax=Pistacia integerrima TaxID=434235 RepID=A0ACC0YMD1_9ROSI|nr:hypothetical protein Pint_23685 [Pistacia integerrima]